MTALVSRQPYLLLILPLATILGAYAFQYIGGYEPCPLCLEQRYPYYVGIPLAAIALWFSLRGEANQTLVLVFSAVVGVVFLYGAYLGAYHAGAEWGFWEGPSDCAGGTGANTTDVGSLLRQLEGAQIVSCLDVQWRFLGLSFAGYNALISLLIAGIAFLPFLAEDEQQDG